MKNICILFLFTVLACFLANAQNSGKIAMVETNYVASTLIVKVKPQFRNKCTVEKIDIETLQPVFDLMQVQSCKKIFTNAKAPAVERNQHGQPLVDLSLIYKIQYSGFQSLQYVANMLSQTKMFEYAEPLPKMFMDYVPNDTAVGSQYALAKINAFTAWDIEQGDTNVVIGITDTGTDFNHPDLIGSVKYNYNDTINGVDDDGDGYIDNYRGWDTETNDNYPQCGTYDHGVSTMGIAAATTDNTTSMAGAGFKCKTLPVKIGGGDNVDYFERAFEGIIYAAEHGCQIINCSWGGYGYSDFYQDVINYATYNFNALVVCSAGNSNIQLLRCPSSFENAFSCASTNASDLKSSYSNYGSTIDVSAPGENIFTTALNGYLTGSGTSFSAPLVSGAAAIVKSHFPSYTGLQVGEQLRMSADNIDTIGNNILYKDKLGKGRINLYRALTESHTSIRLKHPHFSDLNDEAFAINDTIRFTGTFINYLAQSGNVTATLSTTSPYLTILDSLFTIGALNTFDSINNSITPFTFIINNNVPQNFAINLKLTYDDGSYNDFQLFTITVNVDYLNIHVNRINATITSGGRFGYTDDFHSNGIGFKYDGESLLSDGSVMMGKSYLTVADAFIGASFASDNDFVSVQNVQRLPPLVSDDDLQGKMKDTLINPSQGLVVTQNTYGYNTPGNEKYIIVQYKIINTSAVVHSNFYAGLCMNWDIGSPNLNKDAVDSLLKMGYTYSTLPNGKYAATKLLTNGNFFHYGLDFTNTGNGGTQITTGFTGFEKYNCLKTNRNNAGGTGTGNDVIDISSTGPFTISAGDSITVAFALIAGDSLSDIINSATLAQQQYNNIVSVKEITNNNIFGLTIYPNPTSRQTTLTFELSTSAKVSYEIVDVTGRTVLATAPVQYSAGKQNIIINKYFNEGLYFVRLKINEQQFVKKVFFKN